MQNPGQRGLIIWGKFQRNAAFLGICMDLRLAHFELLLKRDGLRAAACYLNSRVSYRFTTIYRLDAKIFTPVEVVDKLGEVHPDASGSTPFNESLCRLPVLHGTFTTSHTAADARLKGLAYPSQVGSYTGVQIARANGQPYGTLCHYDFVPNCISHYEYHFMQLAVHLIARELGVVA